ncbi:MAG: HEPN domain-containing protein [Candidatus Thiodiazotropha sp. (ex Dulcina madagascariensis)]|nr:HEPN domain-containing protein [Candidatus Thiodiazotropha sp. (ex Dulcina madagascariensis)]
MNSDLTYLPQRKRDDLQRVVAIVRERCPAVGMIVLFGSYARGDWREVKDLAPDRRSGHPSDYDILAIFEDEGACDSLAWQAIAKACSAAKLTATPRFIHHDIGFVNRKLAQGQYFFSDIVAEGKALYDAGAFTLAEPKPLLPKERLDIAQRDFAHWFQRAEQFYENYEHNFFKDWMEMAAFSLHQAAESAYKTTLIVFTGYIPDEHYLAILDARAAQVDPAFEAIFPAESNFQRDAFTALEYAYIGARYDKRYSIDEPTVTYLAARVEALLQLTEERCCEKIAALQGAAAD